MALVEDGLEQFRRVPCVTRAVEEEGTVKTILDRLALIFANGFREKSDWEKMEETLRTESLIAELRLLFNEDGTPTPRSKKILAGTPMGRFVASEELLGGVFFLCDRKVNGFQPFQGRKFFVITRQSLSCIFLFFILVVLVGQFLWRICFFGSAIKVEADIRNAMFDHAKDLSQQYYHVNKVGGSPRPPPHSRFPSR